ncbi:MAG: hypothetical protein GY854_10620, partial [Deltaproteobacteria bacterium]|nr:hypothetical protein [Deltaproteobacteria bacterium]
DTDTETEPGVDGGEDDDAASCDCAIPGTRAPLTHLVSLLAGLIRS